MAACRPKIAAREPQVIVLVVVVVVEVISGEWGGSGSGR
jgi:hypothetical protein